jgi:integrase
VSASSASVLSPSSKPPDSGKVTAATSSSTGKRGSVPRRRFQTGTFVKRGDNWVGMWRIDVVQPDGAIKREQRSKTFVGLSERAARAAFQPILDAVNQASGVVPPVPKVTGETLDSLIADWRKEIAGSLKPSTRKAAESHLRRHVVPVLGDCTLTELTAKRLQTFITGLSDGQRKRKTIENIMLTLSSILSTARKWGYDIPKVSLSDLSLPQSNRREIHCFTLDEMRRIIQTADEPLSTICFIPSVTGMRIGEVLALRVEDLDFKRKLIKIRHSVYNGEVGTPKSEASRADLPMPNALEIRLKNHLNSARCKQNALGLLFLNRRGRPYSANKLREKKLQPLLAELGIRRAGFHSFRHAVASELIDSGAPITVVQTQLRHSDPRITLGLYGHVIPQSQRDAVSGLAARLGSQLLTEAGIADSAA